MGEGVCIAVLNPLSVIRYTLSVIRALELMEVVIDKWLGTRPALGVCVLRPRTVDRALAAVSLNISSPYFRLSLLS